METETEQFCFSAVFLTVVQDWYAYDRPLLLPYHAMGQFPRVMLLSASDMMCCAMVVL